MLIYTGAVRIEAYRLMDGAISYPSHSIYVLIFNAKFREQLTEAISAVKRNFCFQWNNKKELTP